MPAHLVKHEGQPDEAAHPWLHPDWGYKPCSNVGVQRARLFNGVAVCPGCSRTCVLPPGIASGEPFYVVKRPAP